MTFNVLVNGAVRQVELCGIIDRMDIVSDPTINDGAETLRIVDYKTNGSMEQALSMDALLRLAKNIRTMSCRPSSTP